MLVCGNSAIPAADADAAHGRQGESDADTIERATSYGKKAERLLTAFRNAFNAPTMPILQVRGGHVAW